MLDIYNLLYKQIRFFFENLIFDWAKELIFNRICRNMFIIDTDFTDLHRRYSKVLIIKFLRVHRIKIKKKSKMMAIEITEGK